MSARTRKSEARAASAPRSNTDCAGCPALCCHDLVMPITKPRTRADIDELKWHLQYETVSVFVANRRWHLKVEGRCMYLTGENLCSIYDRRPQRCRRHNPPDCEYCGSYYDVMINTPEELETYLVGRKRAARGARRRG